MTTKRQSVKLILSNINGNGGFDNFNNWNHKEVCEWIQANFNCSKKLAEKVSHELM